MKTHFTTNENPSTVYSECGRAVSGPRWVTRNVYAVDCLNCKRYSTFKDAKNSADLATEAAFWAQTPRKFTPQFGSDLICECGNDLFRYKGRECHGHYDAYECAECGKSTSRLTETGMCF